MKKEIPRCPCCHRPIPKATVMRTAPRVENTHNPISDWRYNGNLIVTKRHYVIIDGEKRLSAVYLWDGESYRPSYKYFCSNKCAAEYGQLCIQVKR